MSFSDNLKRWWSIFFSRDRPNRGYESGGSLYPSTYRWRPTSSKTSLSSMFNRIALDVASIKIVHARLDENDRFKEVINDDLNERLTLSANIDQTGPALIQDFVLTMLEEGSAVMVPTQTDKIDKNSTGNIWTDSSFKIKSIRVGKIVEWFPNEIIAEVYNEFTGQRDNVRLPKKSVVIVQNPLLDASNSSVSSIGRLNNKLAALDTIDNDTVSGKFNLILQLPWSVRGEIKENLAEKRRKSLEDQLNKSKYGVAYADATEKIVQLNRPLENNLMGQVDYYTKLIHDQLGVSEDVFRGSADEQQMINYDNRIVYPIVSAIVLEITRKWLSQSARTQRQAIKYFKDPFKLAPISTLASVADTFTRNAIISSNEFRDVIGYKPSDDPMADKLVNNNMPVQDQILAEENINYETVENGTGVM